jgi:hypothetical protein
MLDRYPEFLIIGAQRAGTTSFYHSLISHPDICPAARKEVHYFDLRFKRGRQWYSEMFPAKRGRIAGEASPYYIFHPLVAERIKKEFPHMKIVAMLRNPIDRAYSHYQHEVRAKHEAKSFQEAIRLEPKRLKGTADWVKENPDGFQSNHNWYSYLARGRYAEQLASYYDLFDEILLIRSEDYYANPQKFLDVCIRFLGLEPTKLDIRPKPGVRYKEMLSETRQGLIEYFKPYNAELEQLTGRNFQWDK